MDDEQIDDLIVRAGEVILASTAGARAERDELRAILAPLLEDPIRGVEGVDAGPMGACLFCCRRETHAPDCPTLEPRKSALLGRA